MRDDPEFAELVRDFVATLPARRAVLKDLVAKLRARSEKSGEVVAAVEGLRFVVHKLGGVAASYGFPKLSDVSGRIDDWMESAAPASEAELARLERFAELLDRALTRAIASGADPGDELAADPVIAPIWAELISCA